MDMLAWDLMLLVLPPLFLAPHTPFPHFLLFAKYINGSKKEVATNGLAVSFNGSGRAVDVPQRNSPSTQGLRVVVDELRLQRTECCK